MNFARDVVETAPDTGARWSSSRRDGCRREWTFGELAEAAAALAGRLHGLGVERGDVVLTLVGNRAEWALTMLACFRQGFVVLPCTEQLRPRTSGSAWPSRSRGWSSPIRATRRP